ncbi:MAG: hypothetical protein ACXACX_13630 [Candidatus Hodarchaeales archaeon]|jgi:hypothetical protein
MDKVILYLTHNTELKIKMATEYTILAKLGGFIGSNPEIISSSPSLRLIGGETEILKKCFPLGSKVGQFIEDNLNKYLVLSYIFQVKQELERDDLFSFSILLNKRDKVNIYKHAIKELIETLEANGLLCETILRKYHNIIYEGMNQEKDVYVKDLLIEFSRIFKDIKAKVLKQKPQLKGSFF